VRQILTTDDIRAAVRRGKTELVVEPPTVITAAARDEANLAGLRIIEGPKERSSDIVIKVAGERIRATLLLDEAPVTASAIRDLLPLSAPSTMPAWRATSSCSRSGPTWVPRTSPRHRRPATSPTGPTG
jgi:hypothetical protein